MNARVALLCLLLLSGCAGYKPAVDFQASPGKTPETYGRDLAECNDYANDVDVRNPALSSPSTGSYLGGTPGNAAASFGGMGGASGGAATSQLPSPGRYEQKSGIVDRCLEGRGYTLRK